MSTVAGAASSQRGAAINQRRVNRHLRRRVVVGSMHVPWACRSQRHQHAVRHRVPRSYHPCDRTATTATTAAAKHQPACTHATDAAAAAAACMNAQRRLYRCAPYSCRRGVRGGGSGGGAQHGRARLLRNGRQWRGGRGWRRRRGRMASQQGDQGRHHGLWRRVTTWLGATARWRRGGSRSPCASRPPRLPAPCLAASPRTTTRGCAGCRGCGSHNDAPAVNLWRWRRHRLGADAGRSAAARRVPTAALGAVRRAARPGCGSLLRPGRERDGCRG